jgi:hypothetical protein
VLSIDPRTSSPGPWIQDLAQHIGEPFEGRARLLDQVITALIIISKEKRKRAPEIKQAQ